MISKKQLNMYLLDIENMAHDYITDKSENVKNFMWIRLNGALCAGAELGVFDYYPKGFVSCMSGDIYYLCDGDWRFKDYLKGLRAKCVAANEETVNQAMDQIHENLLNNMTPEAKQILEDE